MRRAASQNWLVVSSLLVLGALWGCGGGGSDSSKSGAAGSAGGDGGGSDGALLDPPGDGGASGSDGFEPTQPLGGFFRLGVNGGYPNPKWSDVELAQLEAARGCNSQRVSLPETHLERWGWEIEVADRKAAEELGLTGHVGFLTSPTRAHSTAPADAEDWELVHYLPKNLYEPILRADGTINPENYWGNYVYQTVRTYRDYISIWEIWNEPDWVSDWRVTEEWGTRAPTAEDLPRFHGTVFDYVRMLRVSKVAAQLADPDAKIATGGIGYSSFLAAVLRYTDNPEAGAVSDAYPLKGGAYIDVLSFHHYPIYTAGNSDAAVEGYLSQLDAFHKELGSAKVAIEGWETTETGAPHDAVGTFPGGDVYARNYLLKVLVTAQARGVDGVDWFKLADGAAPGGSDDPYDYMGLYGAVAELTAIEDAVATETGVAYATFGKLLAGAKLDPAGFAPYSLTKEIGGAAYETRDGARALVLWAKATGTEENGSAKVPLAGNWQLHAWDWAVSGATKDVADGEEVELTSTPVVLVETP